MLRNGGYKAHDLVVAGFTIGELTDAKVTVPELISEGCKEKACEMIEDRILALEAANDQSRPAEPMGDHFAQRWFDGLHKALPMESTCGDRCIAFDTAVHAVHEVQEFLRSHQRTYIWMCGGGIANARLHAASLNCGNCGDKTAYTSTATSSENVAWDRRTYSVSAKADGIGDNACVRIVKTSNLLQHKIRCSQCARELEMLRAELLSLKSSFQQLNEQSAPVQIFQTIE
eukprot:gnl/MRDRNA2_/MRDRNA2_71712_c0_seq2.p1 gnl/MRDRNA2_/MRDRNA2_71712_c0~~gnl/MRDRNA2_/MRDRNA2_71712_c0_seq2.p1  ORF type:complete len:230 (+),score=39.48 gnl/MRDRNA2_/MRDRNA2_71712_c0_seq2:340-1029(+)